MKKINLSKYSKDYISNDSVARLIYKDIIAMNPIDNEIIINMEGIITMSVPCINILFGGLYDYLGADKFSQNIVLHSCSDMLGDFISYMLKERLKSYE